MNKEIYIPVICFEGQDHTEVESPEGRPIRGNLAKFFYADKKEAEDALKHIMKQYEKYSYAGKILTYKRVKDAE